MAATAPSLAAHRRAATGMRLNLGCGRDIRPGWVNVDLVPAPGVDVVTDFDADPHLPFADGTVGYSEGVHVIEHLRNPLPFMAELWRVTRSGGIAVFQCPYGSTDDADEDPTHVRRIFPGSWGYFSQPFYWRAQYNIKCERDVFGRRVHPSAQCPWHVPDVRQAVPEVRNNRQAGTAPSAALLIQELRSPVLRQGMVPGPLPPDDRSRMDWADPGQEAERSGAVLEGRLHLRDGSAQSVQGDPGASSGDGDEPGPQAAPLGERPPQERPGGGQLLEQLGTLVQDAASRSESRGLAELARLLVPERIAPTPELGAKGCTCTHADYRYNGDWQLADLTLSVFPEFAGCTDSELWSMIRFQRNVVAEMTAVLKCVKPAREPKRELQEKFALNLHRRKA